MAGPRALACGLRAVHDMGAKAEAWRLLIHADASVFLSLRR